MARKYTHIWALYDKDDETPLIVGTTSEVMEYIDYTDLHKFHNIASHSIRRGNVLLKKYRIYRVYEED